MFVYFILLFVYLLTMPKQNKNKALLEAVNDFASKFIIVRDGHLEFKAKHSEFEKWLESLLNKG